MTQTPSISPYNSRSDLPPAIGWLFDRSGAMGAVLDFGAGCLFIDKSPFAHRVRNALELAYQADNIGNKHLALSLCVSALEALLCTRSGGKVEQLKRRIPAVLQASQSLADDARDSVELLYDMRSRCLHGGEVGLDETQLQRDLPIVRRLLSAVLRGSLEWAVNENCPVAEIDDTDWTKVLKTATKDQNCIQAVAGITRQLSEHLQAFTSAFGRNRIKELLASGDKE
jgi:hypothetical protein